MCHVFRSLFLKNSFNFPSLCVDDVVDGRRFSSKAAEVSEPQNSQKQGNKTRSKNRTKRLHVCAEYKYTENMFHCHSTLHVFLMIIVSFVLVEKPLFDSNRHERLNLPTMRAGHRAPFAVPQQDAFALTPRRARIFQTTVAFTLAPRRARVF